MEPPFTAVLMPSRAIMLESAQNALKSRPTMLRKDVHGIVNADKRLDYKFYLARWIVADVTESSTYSLLQNCKSRQPQYPKLPRTMAEGNQTKINPARIPKHRLTMVYLPTK